MATTWASLVALVGPADTQNRGVVAAAGSSRSLLVYIHDSGLGPAEIVEASFPLSGCTALQQARVERPVPRVLRARLEVIEEAGGKLWLAVGTSGKRFVELEQPWVQGSSHVFLAQADAERTLLYSDLISALFTEGSSAFLAGHAQLLRSLRQPPSPDLSVRALVSLHSQTAYSEDKDSEIALWAAAGQVLSSAEARGAPLEGVDIELSKWPTPAAGGLTLAENYLTAGNKETLAAGNEETLASARKALQRAYEADVKAVIPTFHTVRLAGLMRSASIIPSDAAAVRLQPPAPPPLGPAPDTSAQLADMLPNVRPQLQRSKTLVERDADWERAAKSAVRTLGRYHAAQQQLEEQTQWVEELLSACHRQLALLPSAPPPEALDALSDARHGASRAMQNVADAVSWAQAHGIEKKMRDLAEHGQELRQRTHQLVTRYGPEVGDFSTYELSDDALKGSFVSTAAGFHEKPTAGGTDGAPFNAKGVPLHAVSGPRGLAHLGGSHWLFSEPGSGRLRCLDSSTGELSTIVGGRAGAALPTDGSVDGPAAEAQVRNPGGVLVLDTGTPGDLNVIVADSGLHSLRLLRRTDAGQFHLTTLTASGSRGYKDGALSTAEFREPSALCQAGMDIVVAEAGALRLVQGVVNGRPNPTVNILCGTPGRPGFMDGNGVQARLTAPAGLATAPWNNRLVFFTDRNCVRAVNLKTGLVSTIAGSPTGTGGFKDGLPNEAKFNAPTGLCFWPENDRVLLVADTQNHTLRAVRFSPTAKAGAVSVETVAGRVGKGSWRDGDGAYARLDTPVGFAASADGSVLLSELQGHRLRWLWPPRLRRRATEAYMQLRKPGEELTLELVSLVRECNLGSTVADSLQDARSFVLEGLSAAVTAVYRHSARSSLETLHKLPEQEAETTFAVLLGLAPSAALLCEVLSWAGEAGQALKADVLVDVGRRAVLARLAALTRHEHSGEGAEAEEDKEDRRIREEELDGWISLARTHPRVFGVEVVGGVLRAYAGPPCKALAELCQLSIGTEGRSVEELVKHFEPLHSSLLVAMEAYARSTLVDKEKMTPEKLLKVTLQQWTHVIGQLSMDPRGPAQELAEIARVLLQTGLMSACTGTHEAAASSLLNGVCRGLSVWLGKVDSVSGLFQPFKPDPLIYDIVRTVGQSSCSRLGVDRSLKDLLRRSKDFGRDPKDALADESEKKKQPDAGLTEEFEDATDAALHYSLIESAVPSQPTDEGDVTGWLHSSSPWPAVLVWAIQEDSRVTRLRLGDAFQPLEALANRILAVLERVTAEMESRAVRVGAVNFLEVNAQSLQRVLHAVDLTERFSAALKASGEELREFQTDLVAVEAACEGRLASDEPPMRALEVLRAEMAQFSVKEVRAFFGVGPPEEAHASLPPLPPLLLKATSWLRAHANSKAFDLIWAAAWEKQSEDVEARIRTCVDDWTGLLAKLMDGSLTFGELEPFRQAFSEEAELNLFARSASAASGKGESFSFAPPPRLAPRTTNDRCQEVAAQFTLLSRARHHSKAMQETLGRLAKLVVAESPTVTHAQAAVESLIKAVEALTDWDSTPVSALTEFATSMANIDQRLYSLDDSLLIALQEQGDFLAWLAETFPPPDQNFTSAVEMALGRPEMECPPELWVDRTADRPGHPDEQKLSMLSSVRQALHGYLYRKDGSEFGTFPTLTEAVDCMAAIPGPKAPLVSALIPCGELHLAFAELLADDAQERGATGRLLNLQRPEWQAEWRFRVEGTEAQLVLAYEIPRKGRSISASQTLGEVLDFQSSVVLSRGHGQVAAAVDHFVASFGWAQELTKAYTALAAAGHFAYLRHESAMSLTSPPQLLQAEVDKLQVEKQRWEAFVSDLRSEVPALNWFTMRQLQLLLPLLRKAPETAEDPGTQSATLLAGVTSNVAEAEAALVSLQNMGRKAESCSGAFEELRCLAQGLSAALPSTVPLRKLRQGLTMTMEPGISICAAAKPLQLALTAFLHLGALPEWPLLLLCEPTTTWEEVCNLLHRWTTFEAPHRLFCLCCVDLLPSTVSQELATWLLRRTGPAAAPTGSALLLVSQSMEHPLMRQLAAFRTVLVPAPPEDLRALGSALDGHFSRGAAVISSAVPGVGKTFCAGTHAARRRARRIHVPLHRSVGVSELFQRHGQDLAAPGPKLIHLDIVSSSSAQDAAGQESAVEQLEPLLLQLVLLGGFHDAASGHRWAWDPEETSLCVEVPAAAPASEQSPVLAALPNIHVTPSIDNFCVSDAELLALRSDWPPVAEASQPSCAFEYGQGKPSAELDAVSALQAVTTDAPSPEDRSCVQAVCRALDEYERQQGRCSQKFSVGGPDLSHRQCFGLLVGALGRRLGTREPSISGIFSFARVVHWQLNEFRAAFPSGLANLIQGRSALPVERLQSLNGEVLAFICRTAADFTFRQERPSPENRHAEWLRLCHRLHSGTHYMGAKVEWLQRTAFESNGQPVYRAGTMLDPTYVHFRSPDWVQEPGVNATGPTTLSSQGARLEGRWRDQGSTTTEAAIVSHSAALAESPDLAERDEERALMAGEPGGLTSWDEANHEVLLLSSRDKALSFLARDIKMLRKHVHPGLTAFLEQLDLSVGEEIHKPAVHPLILSRITGVHRNATEAQGLMPGGFCLTGDGLLKLLAIYVRARCGVPVLLQGECGTGKTHMLRYLCKWLKAELVVLDVHGGTTEEDIEATFKEAMQLLERQETNEVFVFLDEVNTCAHMDLICEAMCSRSLHGQPIDRRVRVLAAANPYRKRIKPAEAPGLTYQLRGGGAAVVDPLRDLVYRVHPLPPSLRELLFDFGGLPPEAELQYVNRMAAAQFPDTELAVRAVISRLLQRAQAFVRKAEGDHSAVSLRDVERSFKLARWFQKFGASGKTPGRHPLSAPVVLGLAHVFYFRLPTDELRADLLRQLRLEVTQLDEKAVTMFEWLHPPGVMEKVILSTEKSLCSRLVVEEGIAMNAALMENLYVTLVCICNRVPVFVIGKPGSSKTLTMQVLASNLQGEQSPSQFWRRFPAIYVFSYQCSPFSTALGIKHQYEIACNYQRKAQHTMTVLLLDEVGLAEHSPDMPLKVLHGILVKPKVAIVGLSNWTLDAAKMNRTVCLQRPSPTPSDIHLTGVHLLAPEQAQQETRTGPPGAPPPLQRTRSGASSTPPWLQPLSQAYHEVYTRQRGRDFLGMRDYYQMVHLLWRELMVGTQRTHSQFGEEVLCRALCRNFGGREDLLSGALETFGRECFKRPISPRLVPPVADLVRESLADHKARHVMLLTCYGSALPLTFSHELVPKATPVLVGSAFPEDRHNLYLIQHVNRVKAAMAAGETVILWNLDNIYESLYDVLNQRYVVRTSGGKTRRSLRLAIGARSQLCPVEEGFRLIVIVEKEHAYQDLDLPLLNRFEKFVMEPKSLLSQSQLDVAAQLNEWMAFVLGESGLQDTSGAFCGLHSGLAESLTLVEATQNSKDDSLMLLRARERLAALAMPFAVMRSPTLQAAAPDYGESQGSLLALASKLGPPRADEAAFVLVLTQTPLIPLTGPWVSTRLADVPSEARLVNLLENFYSTVEEDEEKRTLLVQCDPQLTPQFMIDHARLLTERCAAAAPHAQDKRCIFLVHMPSSHRVRQYAVSFHGAWTFYFVDEARPRADVAALAGISTLDLLQKPLYELIKAGAIDLQPVLSQRLQPAMAVIAAPGALPLQDRTVGIRQALEDERRFTTLLEGLVTKSLECISKTSTGLEVPLHVELALGQLSAGSLSLSLNVAIDALLTRALANALSVLDVNSGLDTMAGLGACGRSAEVRDAWLALAEVFMDANAVSACRFDGLFTGRGTPTRNTGTVGHMQARFPFSHRLLSQLKAAWDVLGAKAESDVADQDWDAWCIAQLGESGWQAANKLRDEATGWHLGYLHDVVLGGGAPALPGLEGREHFELHRVILSRSCPEALKTLPGIHWALQKKEALLLGMGAAVALLSLDEQQTVLATASSEASILEQVETFCWNRLCGSAAAGLGRTFAARLTSAAEDLAPLGLVQGGLWQALRTAAIAAAHRPLPQPLLESLRTAGGGQRQVLLGVVRDAAQAGDARLLAVALHVLLDEPTAKAEVLTCVADIVLKQSITASVQRCLLTLLCRFGCADVVLARSPKQEVLQLMLAYAEDAGLQGVDGGVKGLDAKLPDMPRAAGELVSLAQARRCCELEVSTLLHEADLLCRAREKKEKFTPPPRGTVQRCGTPALGVYGLVYAYAKFGMNGLVKLMVLPADRTAWLGISCDKTTVQELHQLREGSVSCDPFRSLLGDHYAQALEALRSVAPYGEEVKHFLDKTSLPVVAVAAALLTKRLQLDLQLHRQDVGETPNLTLDLNLGKLSSAPKAQLQLQWLKGACSGPYCRQAGASYAVRCYSKRILSDASIAQGLFSLTFHAVGLAAVSPEEGFLRKAIFAPERLKTIFLPGMPWDEHQMIYKAMKAERVTWYRCPKGHLYSVGECGGPVMTSRCSHPGCGAVIGGIAHRVAGGNTRVGTFYEMHRDRVSSLSGYPLEGNYATCGYQVARQDYFPSRESVCFHRLLLHLLLIAGAEIFGANHPQKLLNNFRLSDVVARLEMDFETLLEALEWQPAELILGLHRVLANLEPMLLAMDCAFSSTAECERFETLVDDQAIRPVLLEGGARRAIRAEAKQQQATATVSLVRRVLGAGLWNAVQEESVVEGTPAVQTCLWRHRKRASFDDMVASFHQLGPETSKRPLLRAFLHNEERLSLIRLLGDVLAWHSLLFSALGPVPLTREEAAQRSNEDVIQSLPEGERSSACKVLERFCHAFNEALPKLENLYECQRNPFLDSEGNVDLALGSESQPVRMCAATPLHFSLPSHPPGPLADAPGLCTIQILNLLVRIHNEVCQEIAQVSATKPDEAVDMSAAALTVSASTPRALLGRRLISYNRAQDLLPLLFEFAVQSPAYGEGGELSYDFEGLEAAVADRLLAGKRPLALQVRHYMYAGESRTRGGLAALQLVLPQTPSLPPALATALPGELDTREQTVRFLGLLEEAIHFIVAVGSQPSPDSGHDTLLLVYLRDVVMVSKERLVDGLPPSVEQQATLRHLRALFLLAEDRVLAGGQGGGPAVLLPSVLARYRVQMPDDVRETLTTTCARCQEMEAVVPVLHDLLTGVLSDGATTFSAGESLAEFLAYEDVTLEDRPWFRKNFPPELVLGHALEAFRTMTSILTAPAV